VDTGIKISILKVKYDRLKIPGASVLSLFSLSFVCVLCVFEQA